MARTVRDSKLETREARTKLKAGKYYWRGAGKPGLAIGYRKGKQDGSWTVRLMTGPNKYLTKALGKADDYQDANDKDVLSYFQAHTKAGQFADEQTKQQASDTDEPAGPYTVADAIGDYLDWYAVNRKSIDRVRLTCNAHILPVLGDRLISTLTTREIRQWHERLACAPARLRTRQGEAQKTRETNEKRPRQATANRILTILKAALNHAWREGKVASDDGWRRVKPFRNVDSPKIRFLSEAECSRLINACASDFRLLVTAALHTGCRYSELARLRVDDVHPDAGTVFVCESKSGKPRHVPLTAEGQRFFARCCLAKSGTDLIFLRDDGQPWGRSHPQRPLREACKAARIEPAISFHVLRHTYGSLLALKGVPLQVIADVLGHADTRITQRHYAHLMPSFVADTVRASLPGFGTEEDNVTPLRASQ